MSTRPQADAPNRTRRRSGKQSLLREKLAHPEGATLAELSATLGWQPHSVRAAICTLRKRGLSIAYEHTGDGSRRYRLDEWADGNDCEGARS